MAIFMRIVIVTAWAGLCGLLTVSRVVHDEERELHVLQASRHLRRQVDKVETRAEPHVAPPSEPAC